MSKGVSNIYRSQTTGSLRSRWLPDSGTPKGHRKRKKKEVDLAAVHSRKKYRLKLKVGGRLREALGRLKKLENKYVYTPGELPPEAVKLMDQLRADIDRYREDLRLIENGVFPTVGKESQAKAESQPPTDATIHVLGAEEDVTLAVPLPLERVLPDGIIYATREGQAEFRSRIIEAYGGCAITGCIDEAALQAAHIIPYVDARSHLITNGICLRADIHLLFDRGLLTIATDYTIVIAPEVRTPAYRELEGRKLRVPDNLELQPDKALLRSRHRYIFKDKPSGGE